jgi:hypothetical protein
MIVAIERNKFTYLYKYNQIRVDINQIIDQPLENLKGMLQSDFNELLKLFNKAIPLFEQDHEIILLEVEKSKIEFHDGILISFDSILCIYPLTIMGSKLLEGKISYDFIVELPVFEKCVESLKIIRSMVFRKSASEKLLVHFKLSELLNKELLSVIEESVNKNLLDKSEPQVFTSFLDHLIGYNKTPSYIPDGNIEYICKIGAIAIKYLGKPEEVFTNGPFYKSSLKYKSKINNKSYLNSYLDFIIIPDNELKKSYEKMVELISKDYKGVDIFKVSYFFLAFKSFLNKHENKIELLNKEIDTLISEDNNTAALVIAMIGYTFSFEEIYEGIHILSSAPLLKSTKSKKIREVEKLKREEVAAEKKKELEKKSAELEMTKLKQNEIHVDLDIINDTTEGIQKPSIVKTEEVIVSYPIENVSEASAEREAMNVPIEKIEREAAEIIPDDPIVKTEETILTKPIETVSEPIVVYEVNEPQTTVDNKRINMKDEKAQLEEQIINVAEEISRISTERELLTVQIFRSYLSKEQTKPKQKIWFDLLEQFFPNKYEEISLESLLDKLDTIPEVKDKLLKTKKDKESIKAFFDAYK